LSIKTDIDTLLASVSYKNEQYTKSLKELEDLAVYYEQTRTTMRNELLARQNDELTAFDQETKNYQDILAWGRRVFAMHQELLIGEDEANAK
jgi:hypothetical protein